MSDLVNKRSNNPIKNLFQETSFNLGLSAGVMLFIFLNYLSYVISYQKYLTTSRTFSAGAYFIGFPFDAHSTSIGNPISSEVLLLGFTADLLVAVACSFVIGWIVRSFWAKIADRMH